MGSSQFQRKIPPVFLFNPVWQLESSEYLSIFIKCLGSLNKSSFVSGIFSRVGGHGRNPFHISFVIEKTSASVDPIIIVRPTKLYGKFAHVMGKFFNIGRNLGGMKNSCWPPTKDAQFHPQNFAVQWHSTRFTIVTIIVAFWSLDLETFGVK